MLQERYVGVGGDNGCEVPGVKIILHMVGV